MPEKQRRRRKNDDDLVIIPLGFFIAGLLLCRGGAAPPPPPPDVEDEPPPPPIGKANGTVTVLNGAPGDLHGRSISGAGVDIAGVVQNTDSTGVARFVNIDMGTFLMTTGATGFNEDQRSVTIADGFRLTVFLMPNIPGSGPVLFIYITLGGANSPVIFSTQNQDLDQGVILCKEWAAINLAYGTRCFVWWNVAGIGGPASPGGNFLAGI